MLCFYRQKKVFPAQKKSKWLSPYNGNRANFPRNQYSKPGTYLIKSKQTGEIIYVGYSSYNVYKTLYRHFQTWNDQKQNRYVYGKGHYLVRVILTTPTKAQQLEQALIQKYNPPDNKNKQLSFNLTDEQVKEYTNYFKNAETIPF